MAMKKDDIAYFLEMFYPWFTEELIAVLCKKLTGDDLSKLRNEMSEAKFVVLQQFAKELQQMKRKERDSVIEKTANPPDNTEQA